MDFSWISDHFLITFFMIFRCFFKLFFDAIFQCFFTLFWIVCLTYANMNLVKNRWFFIVKMQIRFFAIDLILHQFSIRFWSLFASFFHHFSWLFWHRFLHRFFHWFLIDFGSRNGRFWLPFWTPFSDIAPGSAFGSIVVVLWLPLGSLWLPFGALWAHFGFFGSLWGPFGSLLLALCNPFPKNTFSFYFFRFYRASYCLRGRLSRKRCRSGRARC